MTAVYFTAYNLSAKQKEKCLARIPSHLPADVCWPWQGRKGRNGYGYQDVGPPGRPLRMALAHRLTYCLLVGPIPEGAELDHLCRQHACVNPAHLEPVSHQENIRRAYAILRPLGQVYCGRGHLLTAENVYQYSNPPRRQCRLCVRENNKRRDETQKALRKGA